MRRLKAIAVLVVLALVIVACGGGDSADTTAADTGGTETTAADTGGTETTAADTGGTTVGGGGTLTIGTFTDVTDWAASASEYGNRAQTYQAVYDGLLAAEPDGTVVPWLATEWSYNEDNTVLTLKLRDDVTFTDGTPFNAAAAVANLDAFKAGVSPDASNLANMSEAVAVDDYTLEIHLSIQDPALVNYLARNAALMQSPATIGTPESASYPVGTGPYIMDRDATTIGSTYTFHANPDYWNPDVVKYDTVVFRFIEDPTAMVNAIKTGEIDAANLLNKDTVAEVEAAGYTVLEYTLDWVGLTLVDRDGSMGSPLGDVKVRQAINMAFDRAAILASYGGGYGEVTDQVFPVASPGYHPELEDRYPYDPEAAKALLEEAGYGDGFTLDMPSASAIGETPYAIITDSLGAIGITATHTDESADFFGALLAPKYPAYLMFLEQSPNDWQFINFLIAPAAVWNPANYSDDTSADLISKIQVADESERDALVSDLGAYITEQAWFVPWYRIATTYAISPDVTVEPQVGNAVPFLLSFSPAG